MDYRQLDEGGGALKIFESFTWPTHLTQMFGSLHMQVIAIF